MKTHLSVRHGSAEHLPRAEHLAWKIAEVTTDPVPVVLAFTDGMA